MGSKAPNQGLESTFCCWIAGHRLCTKEVCLSHTPAWYNRRMQEMAWSDMLELSAGPAASKNRFPVLVASGRPRRCCQLGERGARPVFKSFNPSRGYKRPCLAGSWDGLQSARPVFKRFNLEKWAWSLGTLSFQRACLGRDKAQLWDSSPSLWNVRFRLCKDTPCVPAWKCSAFSLPRLHPIREARIWKYGGSARALVGWNCLG